MYIELIKKVLIDLHRIGRTEYKPLYSNNKRWMVKLLISVDSLIRKKDFAICRVIRSSYENRAEGIDWPANADSMIGLKRLDNIEYCINKIIDDKIAGDFIETGVWRGGATIFMKAVLKINNINDKIIWLADSFEGLPKPNEKKYTADKNDSHHLKSELVVTLEQVRSNFENYDLLDDNIKFLKGWFKDTLPTAPIEKLSLLRLDGDMYESTIDALNNLYPKLSKGGFVIIDDWGPVEGCKQAVNDYRKDHGITEKIEQIDWSGVYWRKD